MALGSITLVDAGLLAFGAAGSLAPPALAPAAALLVQAAIGPLLSPMMGLAVAAAAILLTGWLASPDSAS